MKIEDYQKLQALALKSIEKFDKKRFLYDPIYNNSGKEFLGICGPRGVGKTVLLRQLTKNIKHSFYLSLDTATGINLFDVAEHLSSAYGVKTLLLDEVHFYPKINADLKKIYDFLDLRVIFTSSVSLLMTESAHDLSRRVILKTLPPLSFREFVYFRQGNLLPPLTLSDLVSGDIDSSYLQYDYLFDQYVSGGNFSFSEEVQSLHEALRNVVNKIVEKDIPRVQDISISEIELIKNCLAFIGKSSVDGINPTSLSANLKITKYKAQQYLNLLERAFLIQQVSAYGTNVLKEPKVLMLPPYRLLYSSFQNAIGGLREDFASQMLKIVVPDFFYLKNERGKKCPDYLFSVANERVVLEVGGPSKGKTQFKGLNSKFTTLVFKPGAGIQDNQRSLALLGFLY